MAKVLITDSTLTNMANAIRTKTGSSEQYTPSEMVTAIGGISSWNHFGTNPVLVGEQVYEWKFSEISGYSSWNPTTTATTLEAAVTGYHTFNGIDPSNYDYIVQTIVEVIYAYNGTQPNSSTYKYVMIHEGLVSRRYSTSTAYKARVPNLNVSYSGASTFCLVFKTSTGATGAHTQNYGIYPTTFSAPTLSATTGTPVNVSVAKPAIMIRSNSTYMSNNAFSALDSNASYLKITYKLYRVDKNTSVYGYIYNEILKMTEGY